jgi:hypothetical protein
MLGTLILSIFAASASSKLLWDGRLNAYQSAAFLEKWSWSNPVGPYQYYIHGSGPVSEYVKLRPKYKNPADSATKQGIQITIDNTSVWNNDNMLRTELIPQTSAPINQGLVYYHFSVQHTSTHPPSPYEEHQVCFFESHFTEMKYGLISGESGTLDRRLQWMVNGVSYWNTVFRPSKFKQVTIPPRFLTDHSSEQEFGTTLPTASTSTQVVLLSTTPRAVTSSRKLPVPYKFLLRQTELIGISAFFACPLTLGGAILSRKTGISQAYISRMASSRRASVDRELVLG